MTGEQHDAAAPRSPEELAARALEAAYADDWRHGLKVSQKGAVLPSLANCVSILSRDDAWSGVIGYDEFSGRVTKRKPLPGHTEVGEWTDFDDRRTCLWLAQQYSIEPRDRIVFDAIQLVADAHRFHEVREYLENLVWDGRPRICDWLYVYCGAEVAPDELSKPHGQRTTLQYLDAAGTKWLVSAVARIFNPGCKADHVLILEGPQGLGKSSVFAALAGRWFTDAPLRLGDKDSLAVMRGKWIVELAELDSLSRAENSAIKAFFSQYVDRYRAHYERRAIDVPRQQIFGGTTNTRQWLRDETGGRRFWPLWCTDIDLDGLREVRDQLWAEAVHQYRAGTPWHIAAGEWDLFTSQQDARYVGDAWETRVERWLRDPDAGGMVPDRVTTADVLGKGLHLDAAKWTRAEQIRCGIIMQRLGWHRVRAPAADGGGRGWVYVRPDGW